MNKQVFNRDWLFNKGAGTALENMAAKKSEIVSVTLPHDAMISNRRQEDLPYGKSMALMP